jgi:alpha-L-rhamnosidase
MGCEYVAGIGAGWRTARGHVVAADLIAGERVDFGRSPPGWRDPGFDDASWASAVPAEHGYGSLVHTPAPPVRRDEALVPVAITRPSPGRQVVDLGRNINGWVRLNRRGRVGGSAR